MLWTTPQLKWSGQSPHAKLREKNKDHAYIAKRKRKSKCQEWDWERVWAKGLEKSKKLGRRRRENCQERRVCHVEGEKRRKRNPNHAYSRCLRRWVLFCFGLGLTWTILGPTTSLPSHTTITGLKLKFVVQNSLLQSLNKIFIPNLTHKKIITHYLGLNKLPGLKSIWALRPFWVSIEETTPFINEEIDI